MSTIVNTLILKGLNGFLTCELIRTSIPQKQHANHENTRRDIYELPLNRFSAKVIPMTKLAHILPVIQIVLSAILIVAILLQQSASGVGGALGGGDGAAGFHTRRGFEKFLFYLTIVVGVLFAASALLAIFAK